MREGGGEMMRDGGWRDDEGTGVGGGGEMMRERVGWGGEMMREGGWRDDEGWGVER